MRRRALWSAGAIVVVASLGLAAPASAKDVRIRTHIAPEAPAPLSPEQELAVERALNFDDLTISAHAANRSFDAPSLSHPDPLAVSRSGHDDGSSTVTLKKTLSSDWDAHVGADVNMAAAPTTTYQPDQPLPGSADDKPSGAAFASVGVTPYASVDARLDPNREQGQLGATVEHSVPIGGDMSVTLHGRAAVSDSLPATNAAQAGAAPPTVSDDEAVKLDIASIGTTLSAGVNRSSTDPVTHATLSADQKVYGPLHVSTAVTDPGEPTSNKSITAHFNLTW